MIDKLRNKWNNFRRDTQWWLGLSRSYLINATGARILVYHGICRQDPFRFNTLFLKLKTFENHLRFYKRYYNIISLDDFYEQRFNKNGFNICLTFDDGFANNHKYVLPLLQRYQVPATFFITGIRDAGYDILWNDFLSIVGRYGPKTFKYHDDFYVKNRYRKYVSVSTGESLNELLHSSDFVSKKELMQILSLQAGFKVDTRDEDYWQQMTVNQIRELSDCPLTIIGAHGYYHNDLSQVSLDHAKDEMIRSKKYLEIITGKEVKAMAFPYGAYTEPVKEEAKRIGFTQLLTTNFLLPKDENDATMRERLTINPFISVINQMHANITGQYG